VISSGVSPKPPEAITIEEFSFAIVKLF